MSNYNNHMINLKKLLTESSDPKQRVQEAADHVRSGLEKVFGAGDPEISYRRCENVGLGYIKSISEAVKVSVTESRKIAKSFGYKDDETNAKFIKEDNDFSKLSAEDPEHGMAKMTSDEMPHDETDLSNPEENREVQIAKEILNRTQRLVNYIPEEDWGKLVTPLQSLAHELLQIHGVK
jgi:hypothetical protein